jgi:O-antigen ligase
VFAALIFLILKSRLKIPVWCAVVVGLFMSALLFPVVGGRVYDYVTGERYTGRTEIWKASWRVACDYPVLGTGLGTSRLQIPAHIDTPWLKRQDTHSAFLKNAVEMGFPSVMMLVSFYVIFFYYAGRVEEKLNSYYLKQVTRGAMATVLGGIIYSFFENGFIMTAFDAASFVVIWPYAMLALPFAAQKLDEKPESGVQLGS